jgi:hypothetical protein
LQACTARHFTDRQVRHIKESLDLKRTSSPSVATKYEDINYTFFAADR